jgi:hypothetical protein
MCLRFAPRRLFHGAAGTSNGSKVASGICNARLARKRRLPSFWLTLGAKVGVIAGLILVAVQIYQNTAENLK